MESIKKIHFKTLDSTNLYAKENIKNIEDRTIIYCDFQTNGIGRFNRKWFCSKNKQNLFLTFVLKPNIIYQINSPICNLTQYLSMCLVTVLKHYSIQAKIKWPNDVMINEKKVSGILANCICQKNKTLAIILGIGVNLNFNPGDLNYIDQTATALNLEMGREIDRDEFMDILIKEFFSNYDTFLKTGFKLIINNYKKNFLYLNKKVCVKMIDKIISGIITNINNDGTINITKENNEICTVNIGDVEKCLN